jgi:ketosteroid isomerase-like protein
VTGFNEFTAARNGETRQAPAGFTMVLVKSGDQWLIAHQHSSRRSNPTQGG